MKTQSQLILAHLKGGHCVDGMTALNRFQCWRLAARIAELRAAGNRIECRLVKTRTGKRIGVYRLA